MARYTIAIAIALPNLPPDVPFGAETFPALAGAVRALAEAGRQQWLRYAQGEPLPDGQVIGIRSGTYHRSIQLEAIGPFHHRVFSNLAYAEAIESGQPARDLKKILDSSLNVRLSKAGKRYLIIPFRWGTPGTVGFGANVMPPAVHDFWKPPNVARSRVVGVGSRPSGTGAYDLKTRQPVLVPQQQYEWGARLTQKHLATLGIAGSAARRMAGMVNLRQPGGRGGGAHSQFLTFRVMSEDSPGWQAPAIPGKYPAKTVADQVERQLKRLAPLALKVDFTGAPADRMALDAEFARLHQGLA